MEQELFPRPRSGSEKKSPPSKIQTTTCKRVACGLAVPPYHRAKPIYLPSNATDASRGRPTATRKSRMK